MRSVGTSEPEGMLKGWNRTVRTTSAMSRAWTMTLTVSRIPPSRFSLILAPTRTRSMSLFSRPGAPRRGRGLAQRPRPGNAAKVSPARAGLDEHEGLRERRIVGERDVHDRLVAGRGHAFEMLERPSGEAHGRAPAGQVHDLHVAPEHAAPHPRAQGLGAGLL